MAKIKPFKAIRSTRDKSALVSMWSYPTYDKNMISSRISSNPFSFLSIMHIGFKNGLEDGGDLSRFKKVKKKFEEFKNKGIFKKDKTPCFYIYSQITDENIFTGIIAAASTDDYYGSVIKTHEQTITKREEFFKSYLKITGFNAEPVLITHPNNEGIEKVIEKYTAQRAEYEFATTNGFIHKLWIVSDEIDIHFIESKFENIENIYIADGHHRSAASSLLSKEIGTKSKNDSANYFLSLFVSEKNLKIYSFNRLIKDLGELTEKEFLLEIEKTFEVKKTTSSYKVKSNRCFLMYLSGKFYRLKLKKEYKEEKENPLSGLSPYILSETILHPVLGIKDPKTDSRIDFQSEKDGIEKMKEKVDSGEFKVAFNTFPVNFSQIKDVSDKEMIMPPKSTYIEPKLRTGLVVYDIFEKK